MLFYPIYSSIKSEDGVATGFDGDDFLQAPNDNAETKKNRIITRILIYFLFYYANMNRVFAWKYHKWVN